MRQELTLSLSVRGCALLQTAIDRVYQIGRAERLLDSGICAELGSLGEHVEAGAAAGYRDDREMAIPGSQRFDQAEAIAVLQKNVRDDDVWFVRIYDFDCISDSVRDRPSVPRRVEIPRN